jgi:8-oxo-dGTP diphosphatase
LYIDNIDAARQPGTHIRTVGGKRLRDDEMTEYYTGIAAENGGRVTARYINAICLIMDEGRIYEHMGDDIASERFYLVVKPHAKRVAGFPLDSISVHIASGEYYYDIKGYGEKFYFSDDGFPAFFKRSLFGQHS